MLWHCLWVALLPLAVLGQTYYINFVFNNNRYADAQDAVHVSKEAVSRESQSENENESENESQLSVQQESSKKHSHPKADRSPELQLSKEQEEETECEITPSNTDEECETIPKETTKDATAETTASLQEITTTATVTATTSATSSATTLATNTATSTSESSTQSKAPFEPSTPDWLSPTPHPPDFFDYPQAKCHEEMNLHELFGITLTKDRGLPSKVLCEFANSWGGPWLLMNRMELPSRIHMRHWFLGYITEDYKDMNINFLALAHIMNNMRIALLIIGQDNQNRLVYNLYDDFVISGFNDLFMLRKAHLVEANTTDLMFVSIGEVLISDAGRNRLCPFRVMGAWWGHKWKDYHKDFCVFPIERDVRRPGYIAFFIKPSPFEVNNTAFYQTAVTTRRPWASTVNPLLMQRANNDRELYNKLKEEQFLQNKQLVKDELDRRVTHYQSIERRRNLNDKDRS